MRLLINKESGIDSFVEKKGITIIFFDGIGFDSLFFIFFNVSVFSFYAFSASFFYKPIVLSSLKTVVCFSHACKLVHLLKNHVVKLILDGGLSG